MRGRITICTAVALLAGALPATASASHTLSLHLTPTSITSRDDILAFGKLTGSDRGNRKVHLYVVPNTTLRAIRPVRGNILCRIDLSAATDSASATTAPDGTWQTTLSGSTTKVNSQVIAASKLKHPGAHECSVVSTKLGSFKAKAIVTADSPPASTPTDTQISIGAKISPGTSHPHERLSLERRSNGAWQKVASAKTDAGGHAVIKVSFTQPGVKTLRVRFGGDVANTAASSDSFQLTAEQKQNAAFTINPAAHTVTTGESVMVTGTLGGSGSAGRLIQLVGHDVTGFHTLGFLNADPSGNYAFSTGALAHSTALVVEVSDTPSRRSAEAHVIARSIVTLTSVTGPHAGAAYVGDPVTFGGSITPNRHGDEVDLQRQGDGGVWHTIDTAHVKSDGTYSIVHQFLKAGPVPLRVVIPGDDSDGRGVSPVFQGQVDPLP
jgi:hypothetical protein